MPPVDLPAPPIGAEVVLTEFAYMPLVITRVQNSEFWITACKKNPRAALAAVNLWMAAWHQVPAGSLPNNDDVLAEKARVSDEVWAEIREAVMAEFSLCSDNRFYHPTVVEQAIQAYSTKISTSKRVQAVSKAQAARARKGWDTRKAQKNQGDTSTGNAGASIHDSGGQHNELPIKGIEGKGIEKEKKDSCPSGDAGVDAPQIPAPDPQNDARLARQRERRLRDAAEELAFGQFWLAYPRKEAKLAARKAFTKAYAQIVLKTPEKALSADLIDPMIRAVQAYAQEKAREGAEKQFIALPASWLNAGRWMDELGNSGLPKPQARSGANRMAANGG